MAEKTYQRFRYSEDQLERAINDVRNEVLSLNAASKKYGIPKGTLHNKIKNKVPLARKMGPQTVLTNDEEKLLEKWIISKAKLGFPMHPRDVQNAVQRVFQESKRNNPFRDGKPGKKWLSLFLKRRPDIAKRNSEIISKARAAVTDRSIREWFSELERYIDEEGHKEILNNPSRIFNADEMGMCFCPKTGKLLGPKKYKDFYRISSGPEKESITVLCNFSASGLAVPPMVIMPYKRIPRDIASSIPDSYFIGRSDTGWITSDVFYEYIVNCFYPWLIENSIELPILLYLDGHKSHINHILHGFCNEKGLLLYCLPPNATHIMQPCDVSVFKPIKSLWKVVVSEYSQKTTKYITKSTFTPLFEKAFKEAVKPETIQNGFFACGLFPLNPDAVNYDKCINVRQNQIQNPEPLENKNEPVVADFRSTIKVIEHLYPNSITGPQKDNKLFELYSRCKNKTSNSINSNNTFSDIAIDEYPIEFEDMTWFPNSSITSQDISLSKVEEIFNQLDDSVYNLNATKINSETDDLNCVPQSKSPTENIENTFRYDENCNQKLNNENYQSESTQNYEPIFPPNNEVTNLDITNEVQNEHDMEINCLSVNTSSFDKICDNDNMAFRNATDTFVQTFSNSKSSSINCCVDNLNMNTYEHKDLNSSMKSKIDDKINTITTNENEVVTNDKLSVPTTDGDKEDTYTTNSKIVILSDVTVASGKQNVMDVWKKNLTYPKIEATKQKKAKNPMPFALSSKKWKEYYDAKENLKKEQLENIQKRKEDRKRKAEEKLRAKDKKKKTKTVQPVECSTSRSRSADMQLHETTEVLEDATHYSIGDFVVIVYAGEKYPGIIENKDGNDEYEVSTMVSCGKQKDMWKWPTIPDKIWYEKKKVLKKITKPSNINSKEQFNIVV